MKYPTLGFALGAFPSVFILEYEVVLMERAASEISETALSRSTILTSSDNLGHMEDAVQSQISEKLSSPDIDSVCPSSSVRPQIRQIKWACWSVRLQRR